MTIHKLPPCEPDRRCTSLLVHGVLYGPATWQACHAAMQRLPEGVDWVMAPASDILEKDEVRERRPFDDVQALFAPPGEGQGEG
jgi:hypothetical protein